MSFGRWMVAFVALGVLGAPAACAASEPKPDLSGVRFIANVKGRCTSALVNGRDVTATCKPGLVNVGYKTSRLLFLFFLEDMVGFSGEAERPPDFGHSTLDVTVLTLGPEKRVPAKGQCRVAGVPAEKATFTCEAATLDGSYRAAVTVESEGPPTLTKDDEPAASAAPAPGRPEARQATGPAADVEEFQPSAGQLREYHAVYENGDVKHLRAVFSRTQPDGETALLAEAQAYLSGRFIVFSRDPVISGGVQLTVIFPDRPDAVWQAWVYDRKTAQDRYELRGFRRAEVPEEELGRIRKRYRRFLEDREHSM